MDTRNIKNGFLQFLGVTLFAQAVTSLVGGSIFLGPFEPNEISETMLKTIADTINTAYISVFLQIVTGIIIIMLGVAMYQAAGHINKTMAIMALSFYIIEAVLLVVGQIFVYGLVEISQQYIISADANLISLGGLMLSCRDFAGKIAMVPFGLGAIMFYYLMMKATIIPKWLGLYGIITVPLILICVPLMAFGIDLPFFLLIPYVPFEFFTGIYIIVKYRKL